MGTLYITEFRDWPLVGVPLAEQAIEFGDRPVSSKPLHNMTKGIRVSSDGPCGLSLDGSPARPDRHRMPADTDREYQIDGTIKAVSVVASGAGGNASELDALKAYADAIRAAAKVTDPEWLDGRIAELTVATEAHNAAKAAAEAARADAGAALVLAKAAQKTADEMRASFAPQADQIAADAADLERAQAELRLRETALAAERDALTADQQKLEAKRASIKDEVDRQIGAMRDDYTAKMRGLGDSVAAVKEREAAVAAREVALQAAKFEHAANLAEMQKMALKLSGAG